MDIVLRLICIDESGIYTLPDGYTVDQVDSVYVNDRVLSIDEYTITENKNIDIIEPLEKGSKVTCTIL